MAAWSQVLPLDIASIEVTTSLALVAISKDTVGEGMINAFRLDDGKPVWSRPGALLRVVDDGLERILAWSGFDVVVLRASDGAELARFGTPKAYNYSHQADAGRILVEPHGRDDEPIFLVDAAARVQVLARNVDSFDEVVSDVLLSRNAGSLEAYSLTHFGVPEVRLPPRERVLSVLGRYPNHGWQGCLEALRPIPGWQDELEKVVAEPPAKLREAAFAAAGASGDLRYVKPLIAHLERVPETLDSDEQWAAFVDLLMPLEALRDERVPTALQALWQRVGAKLRPWRRQVLHDAVADSFYAYGALKDWAQCRPATFARGIASPTATLGTPSPGVGYQVDPGQRWAAICEARKDDDGNGRLEVVTLHHGDTGGDELEPYLVLGSGPGTRIDDFVAADPQGKWLVVTKDMCVHLVDVALGSSVILRGADGRPGDTVVGGHRAADFSADGNHVLYIKSNGPQASIVVQDLRSGAERSVDPGPGQLASAFFEPSGRFVVMEMLTRDTDGDGKLSAPTTATTLGQRRCRGPAMSASFFGQIGDRPVQRIVPIQGGKVEDAPAGQPFEAVVPQEPPYELASPPAPPKPGADQLHPTIPTGPFHWEPSK